MVKKKQDHGYKLILKDMKADNISNIIIMYGEEDFLINWSVNQLVNRYVNPASRTLDYVVYDEGVVDADRIVESAETFPMFSQRKIVWVKNFKALASDNRRFLSEGDRKMLTDYAENANGDSILIFSNPEGDENSKFFAEMKPFASLYSFPHLNPKELASFIAKRLNNRNITISDSNLKNLIDVTGYFNKESKYNLYTLENDLTKLMDYSNGREIISTDIDMTITRDEDTFVFNFLDSIMANRKDKALLLLHNMLADKANVYQLLSTIISQFELLLSTKQLVQDANNKTQIAKTLKANEYRIEKLMAYTGIPLEQIKRILSSAYQVDRNIKMGILREDLALEMLIAQL